jgi:hypothetical protein
MIESLTKPRVNSGIQQVGMHADGAMRFDRLNVWDAMLIAATTASACFALLSIGLLALFSAPTEASSPDASSFGALSAFLLFSGVAFFYTLVVAIPIRWLLTKSGDANRFSATAFGAATGLVIGLPASVELGMSIGFTAACAAWVFESIMQFCKARRLHDGVES